MIPIRDTIPSRRIAWVTRAILIINILVFALEVSQGAKLTSFLYRYGVVPSHWLISTPADFMDWPSLFLNLVISQFLHAGFLHLGFNMLYLWIFADNVEDRMGHANFLTLYLGCGIVAAVVQILFSPTSSVPMVGASGAIAGILGAYMILFPTSRIITLLPLGFIMRTVEVPAIIFLGFWFLLQWVQGVTSLGQVADVGGVAFWAHIGGFISGIVGVGILRKNRHRLLKEK